MLIAGSILNCVAFLLYLRAIQISEISSVVPLIAFTSMFLLIISPIMIGEIPTVYGFIGVVLIIAGSYILNIEKGQRKLTEPLKRLLTNKGSRLMLLTAFIWSITSNIDKIGIKNSSPLFWVISEKIVILIIVSIILLFSSYRTPFIDSIH